MILVCTIDHGATLKVVDVDAWYDAGKVETLLKTHQVMIEKGRARRLAAPWPSVSTGAGTVVEGVQGRVSVGDHGEVRGG